MPTWLRRNIHWLPLLTAIGLGAFLRFPDLRTAPPWYSDEGTNIAISAALARGELGYMAIGQSSFINGHPHLFYLLLAALFRLAGVDILWARLLSAMLGFLALILLYPVVSAIAGRRIALLATILYAFYPGAVVYTRLAFTYSLLTPLYLVALYAVHRYLDQERRAWLLLAALCAGLAPVTDLAGIALPIFLVLVLLLRRPRHLLLTLPLLALPTLAWGLWMWASAGNAFLFDWAFTLSRTGGSLTLQLARIVSHYRDGLAWDLWFALGSMGLLLLPTRRSRGLIGGFYFSSLVLLTRTVNIGGLRYYFLIPYHPLISAGVSTLALRGWPYVISQFEDDFGSWLAARFPWPRWRRPAVLLVNSIFVFLFAISPFVADLQRATSLDSFPSVRLGLSGIFASPEAGVQATSYVNAHTSADDVVLASPTIAWLLTACAADFQMAVAATGHPSYHLPANIPSSRFRCDPRLGNAAYVITDPLWRNWGSQTMPQVADMVEEVEEEWVLESEFGEFEIYRNPSLEE
ncbi:MAG: glycosyltransferase family 39 protein [Anaerolineae bacterium]|jgi:4-amino-4-deoxy-L-arabinose transferase-like glycosyltransferase